MKISPVQGTPTIQQPSLTGLSPEKLERLKSIASGQKPEEEEVQAIGAVDAGGKTQSIKMAVNKTPEAVVAAATEVPAVENTAQSNISDTSNTANEASEVVQPLSPQLAAIARQRRALQLKEKELAEKEKALTGPSRADLESQLKASPLKVLQELGVTYDQLTNEILAQQNGGIDASALEKSIIEKITKNIDSKFSEKDTAQEQAVFAHMKSNIDKLSFSSDKFKLIRESKSQEDVLDLIRRSWKEQGDVLSEEEAMELVEKELREDAKRFAKMITELEPTTEAPVVPTAQTKPQMKTLTNKDTAKPVMGRRQRAIAAALGQLPKG